MPSAAQIVRHHDPDPDENPWVDGPPPPATVELVDYDERWPRRFDELAAQLRDVLGDRVLELAHVGSTAVPGLVAKDVIDIDLVVADPRDEQRYLPPLSAIGWRHTVREPSWHEHRALRHAEPAANLHVFGPDCPETVRHRMFRDWLRAHADDRARYVSAKRAAVPGGGHVMDYNARKQDVVRQIYDRAFRAAGLLPLVSPRLVGRVRTEHPGAADTIVTTLEDVPDCFPGSASQDRERLQAAVVLGSQGRAESIDDLMTMGRTDWRDLLVAGGVADGDWRSVLDRELGRT